MISPFTFHLSLLNLHTTVNKWREGVQQKPSQKTCHNLLTIIQSFRVKGMECKSCKAFIFLSFFYLTGSSHKEIFQKMKKKIFIAAAVLFSSQSFAQQLVPTNSGDSATMDEVVVTATKTRVKQSQTGKVVTVINQSTLQKSAGKSLTEILNYQAGVFVNGANNNPGSNQDYYLRGATTGNTLILVDGVPVADPSYISSYFDLNNINPQQVERIEILKGAQSTLWGSDAVAGVINIITKKGGAGKTGANAMLSYGSYQTFKANAGINGNVDKFTYNLQWGYTNSKGFSSAYDSTGNAGFDNDKFIQNNFQANLGYRIGSKLALRYTSNYGKYNTGLDAGIFKDDKDYTNKNSNFINSVALSYTGKNASLSFVNSYINTKRLLVDDSASVGGFSTYARGNYKGFSFISELYGNISLAKKLSLVAGLQRMAQKTSQSYLSISSYGPYETALGDSAKTTNFAVYSSLSLLSFHNFNAEAGIRFNHHSIYGNNATWSFNPSYNIDDNTRVFVNLSSAYRVPSLYQLYSEYGNKDLLPEKSNNYEIGVQSFSNSKKNSLRLVAFKRDIKDVIVFYTDNNSYESKYINRDEQQDYGFEVESSFAITSIGHWVTNLSYVDGEGKTGNEKIKNLYRRPNFNFNSSLSIEPVKGLTLMPGFRLVGTRLKGEYDAGPAVMPQYYTIDFYVAYQLAKQIRIFSDWRNITDQKYFDIPGYNSRMANYTIGLNARF
jgi:vitamin B12 transporter